MLAKLILSLFYNQSLLHWKYECENKIAYLNIYIYIYIYIYKVNKVGDHSEGWPKGSLFDNFYTKVYERALLLTSDCSTLPLIRSL